MRIPFLELDVVHTTVRSPDRNRISYLLGKWIKASARLKGNNQLLYKNEIQCSIKWVQLIDGKHPTRPLIFILKKND